MAVKIVASLVLIALNANTRGQRGGCFWAIVLNMGGLALWLAFQYGKDFIRGVAL
ncbi:hypothetical protein [Cohnella hashimotonis]|uniref:Uncharacterized protein n=1 Tax=Cohnella hashimotonis TaxID=2826895 RepID=A0ABT6TNC5_9BACL|nr:hypothetical protein [Cohnella hashimotonis]MDI4648362.1 hypothetical protein [Cohnella hashimotonis]